MANIDENFVVKTGLTVGPTDISAATGNITMTSGTITVGSTKIDAATGNITIGATTINGATGAITTTANVTTTSNFIVGDTVLTSAGTVSTANIIATGGTINNVVIGGANAAAAHFTTLSTTGNLTVSSDILPTSNGAINIGSASNRFGTIYVNEARLSTSTLYLGDTAILGTTNNVVQIHTDSGQGISMQTTGAAGTMSFVSNAQVSMQTTGNNADILIQSNGTGSKTRLLSATELDLTAPAISVVGNITSTGSTLLNGNLTVSGGLSLTGVASSITTQTLNIKDPTVIVNFGEPGAGVTSGSGRAGLQFARGQLQSYQLQFVEGATPSLQFGPIGSTTKVAVENGGGSIVGNITGSSASCTGAALTAATVTGAAQTAITSVGTLGALAVTGNVTAANFVGAAVGSGAGLTSIPNGALTNSSVTVGSTAIALGASATTLAGLSSVTSTTFVGALTGAASTAATVTGAAQTAITSVGTLASLAVTANVVAGGFSGTHYGSGAGLTSIPNGALTNSSVTVTAGTGMSGGGAVSLGGTVTLTNAGVTQITGTANQITASGSTGAITLSLPTNLTGVTINSTTIPSTSTLVTTAAGTATLATALAAGTTGAVVYQSAAGTSAFLTAGTTSQVMVSGASGPSWTNTPTLTGTNFTGIPNASIIGLQNSATTIATSSNVASQIVLRDASGSFSAGVVTAVATSARYADLAEFYTADAEYGPASVVEFGGDAEVTLASDSSRKVAGVVSTNPAYLMNNELAGTRAAVALQGRVPCKVVGKIVKGDMLVSAGNGFARAEANPQLGQVIGKALESFDGTEGVIEVVVGRM